MARLIITCNIWRFFQVGVFICFLFNPFISSTGGFSSVFTFVIDLDIVCFLSSLYFYFSRLYLVTELSIEMHLYLVEPV